MANLSYPLVSVLHKLGRLFVIVMLVVTGLTAAPETSRAETGARSLALVKTANSSEIFIRISIGRYMIRDAEAWNRWGFSTSQIQTISDAEMRAIPRGPDIGKALRPFGDPTVFVVDNGQTRGVTSAEAFVLAGYAWGEVSDVERVIIDVLPRTVDLEAPRAIQSPRDGRIFTVNNGRKFHITDANTYAQWRFDGFFTNAAIDSIPDGGQLTTLVKSPNDPTVWVVDQGTRRPLPSPDALLLNNFSWSAMRTIDQAIINRLPIGDIFYAPTTVRLPGNDQLFFVFNGRRYPLKDTDTNAQWGFNKLGSTTSAALASYPQGPTLTRLARTEDGTVYRIVDRQFRAITSAGMFTGYGFSWADVTDIPIAALRAFLTQGPALADTTTVLNGYTIPATTGKTGLEQHLWTTANDNTEAEHYALKNVPTMGEFINVRNGVAGTGAFGRISPEIEQYYITMRWNYCGWREDPDGTVYPPDGKPDTWCPSSTFNSVAHAWHRGKKVIVTNPRNGRKLVAAIGEAGPAIWVTREQGVVGGLSPEGVDYVVGNKYNTGGDVIEFAWAVDQSLPLGPLRY
jgi:hypothetical protein